MSDHKLQPVWFKSNLRARAIHGVPIEDVKHI